MEAVIDEVLRYIGGGKTDTKLRLEIERLCGEILKQLNPRKVVARFGVKQTAGGFLLEGTEVILKGKLIERTTTGAAEAFLFAATLGLESELLLKQYMAIDNLSGLICDGILTAAIENFCDSIESAIKSEAAEERKKTRARISCGYGDFDISYHKDFLRLLNAEKLLGIKMNDKFMICPNKTVTALVAVESKASGKESPSGAYSCAAVKE